MNTAEIICEELGLDLSKVLNIYPYGSKIYGADDEYSDSDYVIVFKSSLLPSGAFKDNAISSEDRKIQGTCYSRSGFIDAINNYEITALECIFLPEDKIIQKKMDFKITRFYNSEFSKKIIMKASNCWHFAKLSFEDDNLISAKKNVYHAIRILNFGLQIKKNQKIIDYSHMNSFKTRVYTDDNFKLKTYYGLFMSLSQKIKE